MDSNCKKAIRSLMQELKENLSVSIKDFISLLHKDSKGFLSTVEVKRVRGQTQPMDQVQELLDILLTKTTDDFYTFCNVLESSNNQLWADELRSQAGSNLAKPSGAKAKKRKKKTKAARKSGHSSSTSPKPQAQHGNGLKQDEEKVEVSNPVPEQVTGVMISAVIGDRAIRVGWAKPNSDRPIISYEVEYGVSGVSSFSKTVSGADSLTTTITNLQRGSTYFTHVRAVSNAGNGDYSPTPDPMVTIPNDIPEKTSKWSRFECATCWVLCSAFFILVGIFIFAILLEDYVLLLCKSMAVFCWFPKWLEAYCEVVTVVKTIAAAVLSLSMLLVLLCALKRTCSSPASSQSSSFERPWLLAEDKHGELLVKMDKWSDMEGCIIKGESVSKSTGTFTAFIIKWFGRYYFVTAYHIYLPLGKLPPFKDWHKKYDEASVRRRFRDTACNYYLVNEDNEHNAHLLPIHQFFIDVRRDVVVAPIQLDKYPEPWQRLLDHGSEGDWKNQNLKNNKKYFSELEKRTVSLFQYIDGDLYRSSGDISKCIIENWKLKYKARTDQGSSGAALIVTVPGRANPKVNWPMIIGVHSGSPGKGELLSEGYFLFPFLDQVHKDIKGDTSLDLNHYFKLNLTEP